MKFFKKLSKGQRILVGGLYALTFLAMAGGVLAAWLLQAKSTGSVLGTKAKKLEIAEYQAGSCIGYSQDYPVFWNRPEMTAGTRYDTGMCVKSNKPIVSATYQAENVQYYKFDTLIGSAPEVGDSDLAEKLYFYIGTTDGGVVSMTLNQLKLGTTVPWDGGLEDGASDFTEVDVQQDAAIESDATLNGYRVIFDLVVTGNES